MAITTDALTCTPSDPQYRMAFTAPRHSPGTHRSHQSSHRCFAPRGLPSRFPSFSSRPLHAVQPAEPPLDNNAAVNELLWRLHTVPPRTRGGKSVAALPAISPVAAGGATASAEAAGKARVTVRRAQEADYEGLAAIRGVIVPVGISGATGFMGDKVVIDDPAEAKRRLLMAKVLFCLYRVI